MCAMYVVFTVSLPVNTMRDIDFEVHCMGHTCISGCFGPCYNSCDVPLFNDLLLVVVNSLADM